MGKKSDIRIDFINFVESPDESISYPTGILYLSACLKKYNYTNIGLTEHICLLRKLSEKENDPPELRFYPKQYLQNIREENYKKLITYLEERRPHIIFLGPITTYHLVELVYLSTKLREYFEEQVFIAGGPHFGKDILLDKELMDTCFDLDGLVVGEAEETIIEIADLFYSKYVRNGAIPSRMDYLNELTQIPGVLTRINDFQVRDPPSLENSPIPDVWLLEEYWNSGHVTTQYDYSLSLRRNPVIYTDRGYFQGEADWGIIDQDIHRFSSLRSHLTHFPFGFIVGSRGCPYSCSFCSSSGDRRVHSARYIFDLITYINQRYKTETFVFFESLFTTASQNEQQRILELCNLLINSNLNIEYMIEIRADIVLDLPANVVASMIQSGCVEFNLGLEKGTDRSLKKIRKGVRIHHHFDAVNKLRRVAKYIGREIIVNGTFIFGGPGETKLDIMNTLFHSWRLHLDEVTFYIMNIFPGTKIYREALRENVIKPGLGPYLDVEWFPIYVTEDLLPCLNRVKRLNDDARRALSEFRKAVKELEFQFMPEETRILSNIMYDATGNLYQSFCDFIDAALDLVRYSDDGLLVNGEINSALQDRVQKLKNEIHLVEERLLEQYPDHDPYVNGYHLGAITDLMWRFITRLGKLLDNEVCARVIHTFDGFEP